MTVTMLRRAGRQIVDAAGQPVLLRGVGLGNWLLPEGYMWLFGDEAASPRQIEALVSDLIGPDAAAAFWTRFRDTYLTADDIAAIAGCGYNSIRLPFNWRVLMAADGTLLEDGFAHLERIIAACRTHDLYVVLDLHGAPGGQTGANIDDSTGWPDLFTDANNVELTVTLWRELATRYRHDPIIAAYDLLNEPLPDDHRARYGAQLVDLYQRLIREIREIDPEHLITLEGMHWSNDWSIFTELWDEQVFLQFHKYWNAPDLDSIQGYLDIRDKLDVPIWLGESGENHLEWFQATFGMCDDQGIGWNFWQWKKMANGVSPASIRKPSGWEQIQAYALGGPAPSREAAQAILDEYLDNILLANCDWQPEVVHAMTRRAPLRLAAAHFAHLGEGVSWSAAKRDTGLTGFRESEGVTIGFVDPHRAGAAAFPSSKVQAPLPEDALEIRLIAGEWVSYRVEFTATGPVTVQVIGSGEPDTALRVSLDGVDLAAAPDEPWTFTGAVTTTGVRDLRLTVDSGAARVQALDIRTAGSH